MTLPRLTRLILPFAALFVCLASAAHAGGPVNKTLLGGVAIDGYDPVAYFTDAKPIAGSKEFQTSHQGATWYFASAEHRDAFIKEPDKFAPQYGGYCAYAVGNGYTADIDPEAWSIVNGKLYLNYSLKVRETWIKDQVNLIAKGDQNWPKLAKK